MIYIIFKYTNFSFTYFNTECDKMSIILYFLIFISKVIENGLATLRIIVVANGKKKLGAFLQFIIALVWILVTGVVVNNITDDPLKIVFFALGSLVGSYIGSIIEETIAIGNIMINCITKLDILIPVLKNMNYDLMIFKNNDKYIINFIIARKNKKELIKLIKTYDSNVLILSEKIKILSN